MNRRDVLTASAGAAVLAASRGGSADEPAPSPPPGREYYELRQYSVRRGIQSDITRNYFASALVPALNRMGINPVGVFEATIGGAGPNFYVLLPAKNLETLATVESRLGQDAIYQEAGGKFLAATSAQPSLERMDSAWMVAFEGWPRLQVPQAGTERKKRIFELRTYESPSDLDYRRKVQMFNSGEYSAFISAGFSPVFFGDVLAGQRLPCLTYMLEFQDLGQRESLWKAFLTTREWKLLTSDQRFIFDEIISKIDNFILSPLECSQI